MPAQRALSAIAALTLSTVPLLTGCPDRPAGPTAPTVAVASSPVAVTPATPEPDRWLGQWQGPEGTFLRLSGGQGQYEITIQNLDGPRLFQGRAVGSQVEFERDGLRESIHATRGPETGMKWLADKTNCLTIRLGEGYCRD